MCSIRNSIYSVIYHSKLLGTRPREKECIVKFRKTPDIQYSYTVPQSSQESILDNTGLIKQSIGSQEKRKRVVVVVAVVVIQVAALTIVIVVVVVAAAVILSVVIVVVIETVVVV